MTVERLAGRSHPRAEARSILSRVLRWLRPDEYKRRPTLRYIISSKAYCTARLIWRMKG